MLRWIKKYIVTRKQEKFVNITKDYAAAFLELVENQAQEFQAILDRIPIENFAETCPSQQLKDDTLSISFHMLCRAVNSLVGQARRDEFVNLLLAELSEPLSNRGSKNMGEIVDMLNDEELKYSQFCMIPNGGSKSPKGTISWEAAKLIAAKHHETNPASITLMSYCISQLYILQFDVLKKFGLK